jgi:hypothetical protein
MTQAESISMLRYAMSIYPSIRWTEEQLKQSSIIWASEFADKACDLVAAAFKLARKDSPDWLPSVPRIQEALEKIEVEAKARSDEEAFRAANNGKSRKEIEEFKASHCGKTKEEWDEMKKWETSVDGSKKILEYKKRFSLLMRELSE